MSALEKIVQSIPRLGEWAMQSPLGPIYYGLVTPLAEAHFHGHIYHKTALLVPEVAVAGWLAPQVLTEGLEAITYAIDVTLATAPKERLVEKKRTQKPWPIRTRALLATAAGIAGSYALQKIAPDSLSDHAELREFAALALPVYAGLTYAGLRTRAQKSNLNIWKKTLQRWWQEKIKKNYLYAQEIQEELAQQPTSSEKHTQRYLHLARLARRNNNILCAQEAVKEAYNWQQASWHGASGYDQVTHLCGAEVVHALQTVPRIITATTLEDAVELYLAGYPQTARKIIKKECQKTQDPTLHFLAGIITKNQHKKQEAAQRAAEHLPWQDLQAASAHTIVLVRDGVFGYEIIGKGGKKESLEKEEALTRNIREQLQDDPYFDTVAPLGVVQVQGQPLLLTEYVPGVTILDMSDAGYPEQERKIATAATAWITIRLQQIHAKTTLPIRDYRASTLAAIANDDLRNRLEEYIDALLPDCVPGVRDFDRHPGNTMLTPWGTYVILDLEDRPGGTNPERDHAKIGYVTTDSTELQEYFARAQRQLRTYGIYLSEKEFFKSIALLACSAASPLSVQGREQERENLQINALWALQQLYTKTHKQAYRVLERWMHEFTHDRS